MENLRSSVKLKKRANPLEKIITKLINVENQKDEIKTPFFNNANAKNTVKSSPVPNKTGQSN